MPDELRRTVLPKGSYGAVRAAVGDEAALALHGALEDAPYDTPVESGGSTYRAIADQHGNVAITRDGRIIFLENMDPDRPIANRTGGAR